MSAKAIKLLDRVALLLFLVLGASVCMALYSSAELEKALEEVQTREREINKKLKSKLKEVVNEDD